MKRLLPLLVVLAAVLLCPAPGAALPPPTNALVLAQDGQAAANQMEACGGQAYHIFDQAVIGYLPPQAKLPGKGTVTQVCRRPVAPGQLAGLGRTAKFAAIAWNNSVWGQQPPGMLWRVPTPARPLINDCFRVPPRPAQPGLPGKAAVGAGRYQISEFLMGKVAIGIWLPESAGSAENWTADRQNQVIAGIQAGAEWWRQRETTAKLSFVYDVHLSVPVNIEPIQASYSEEGVWINQAFATAGYANPDHFENAYSYNNDLRQSKGTDWAVTVFVADSQNDDDGAFPEYLFGYTYLGGPFIVMTYDNDGYGIQNMNTVFSHEMGHDFYALDEYAGPSDVSERAGYFNELNGNYEDGGIINVDCIMRGGLEPYPTGSVCRYTRKHVGWRDANGNTIQDILDVPPVCTLTAYTPDPSANPVLDYQGTARVGLLPNQNSQCHDLPAPAMTLNTITAVEFRVDGSAWARATAGDGTFNSGQETYHFRVTLPDGDYTVEARARDNNGTYSPAVSDTVSVLTGAPMVAEATPANGATEVTMDAILTARFSEDMDASTITTSTFTLTGAQIGPVAGTVSYDDASRTATFTPSQMLAVDTYTASVLEGPSGVKDLDGIAMILNYTWTFTVPEDITVPTLSFANPLAGATVRGLVPIHALAEDPAGVARVEFFVDYVFQGADTTAPFELSWNTMSLAVADGSHQLMARAYDRGGRMATTTISVSVDNSTFDDVPKGSALWPYVEALAREGVVSGCLVTPPLFCPQAGVTRGQMAVFLCRATGVAPYDNPTPTFADVSRTNSQYTYIEALYRAGVVAGCATSPLRYCPDTVVTRGQMAVFLCRAAGLAPYAKASPSFLDVPPTSGQYASIEAIHRAAISAGCSAYPSLFCPTSPISRGQMAVFLCRTFNLAL